MKFDFKRILNPVEILVSLVSVIALMGIFNWFSHTWQTASFNVLLFPMAPSTGLAILLLCFNIGLSNLSLKSRFIRPLLFSIMGLLAVYTLYNLFHAVFRLGPPLIDQYLSGFQYINRVPLGVMSPITALMALLTIVSLRGTFTVLKFQKVWRITGFAIGTINILITLTIVMSYVVGMPMFFNLQTTPMALLTALSLLLLNVAIIGMYGTKGWMSGFFPNTPIDVYAKPRILRSKSVYSFLLVTTLIVIGGQFFLKQSYNSVRENAYHELEIIGSLKNTQISRWYNDRLTDATVISENEFVGAHVLDLIRGKSTPERQDDIYQWMQSRVSNYHYTRFSIFNQNGEELIKSPKDDETLKTIYDPYFDKAIKEKRIIASDLHVNKRVSDSHSARVVFDIWIPILNSSGIAEGAWLLEYNPRLQLFPLIQRWPTYSRTGETVLVGKRGRETIILNELKFQANTALELRYDINLYYAMPASMAVKGITGIVEALDYRDKPVLAFIGPVEGTPWFSVVKIDREEVYKPLQHKIWIVWGFILLLITLSALGLGYWERQSDKQWLLRQYTLSLEHQKNAERIANLTKYANDIILTLDKDCNIIEANQKAVEIYGYSEEELKKLNYRDLIIPSKSELHSKIACDFTTKKENILETTHVAKDGKQIEVESSSHSIQVQDEIFQQVIVRDITEKKKAAEAIRLSEEKFRKAFTTIPDSITISRASDGLFYMVNDGFTELTGYTKQDAEGKTSVELNIWKNPEDRNFVISELRNNQEVRNFEADFVTKHGELHGLMSATTIVIDSEKYILSVIRDISDRYKAENIIRVSEEKFRNLFYNSPLGKSMTSITGEMKVNKAFCDIVGYTEKELLAKKWTEITHHDDIAESREIVDGLINGDKDKFNYEKRYIHKSGRIVWADVSTILQKDADGQPLYFITSISDITPKKLAAEQLQNLTQRLKTIINKAPFGAHTYTLDKDNNLIFMGYNLAAETMLKIDHKALIGMNLEDAFPMHKQTDIPDICRRVALTGEPYQALDYLYEGDRVAGTFEIWTIQTGERQVTSFFIDVTDRQRAEAEINALNQTLEQKIVERTLALTTANMDLEAFSYSVSHDLRSPLRGIDGWSNALLEDYQDKLDEQGILYLNTIRAESQRMGVLIDSLLNLSKASRGEIDMHETNLSQLAQNIIDRIRPTVSSRKIEVTIQPDMVDLCDNRLMDIVLTNLFSNAVKFTANKTKTQIEFGKISVEGKSAYYVKDNGIGFNVNYSVKLFEAFQRLHKHTEFPGTGIGLAIVKRIINRHGGRVWAKSEPDKYAIFYFTLMEA